MTSTEEEDKPRIVPVTELTTDGKTESVPIEPSAAIPVGWSQQNPATEDVHTPDHSARPVASARALPLEPKKTWLGSAAQLELLEKLNTESRLVIFMSRRTGGAAPRR